jgi:hypothetical protein
LQKSLVVSSHELSSVQAASTALTVALQTPATQYKPGRQGTASLQALPAAARTTHFAWTHE